MGCRIIKTREMKYIKKIALVTLVTLAQIQTVVAQSTPPFDDDVQDVPVDNWIIPMALLGIGVVFFIIKKKPIINK
jgi:hypothetical protein